MWMSQWHTARELYGQLGWLAAAWRTTVPHLDQDFVDLGNYSIPVEVCRESKCLVKLQQRPYGMMILGLQLHGTSHQCKCSPMSQLAHQVKLRSNHLHIAHWGRAVL